MLRREFPNMPTYNRFVELAQRALPAMLVFLKTQMGQCTDVGVVDSTALAVCHNRRIHSHKVFNDIAKRGKTSTGWFYGFKLHAVFNRLGELVTFHLSTGNTDNRQALKQIAKQLSGTPAPFGEGVFVKSDFGFGGVLPVPVQTDDVQEKVFAIQ